MSSRRTSTPLPAGAPATPPPFTADHRKDPDMRVTIRTNHDDWTEVSTDAVIGVIHAGHDIPQRIWIGLLQAAGVQVDVVEVDFEAEQ